ncbi:MAG: hypothetical protein GY944_01045 [bacterium]|nr:hypothetical protein [bacterium]
MVKAHTAVGRYAPSTTGPAHPGTLLAALLCWLDARALGDRVLLRLEDLDPDRCKPDFVRGMIEALAWLGLDWDEVSCQSDRVDEHEAALDDLAERGLLYPCACSRARLRELGVRTPDGGFRYDNACRRRELPAASDGGWRATREPLRARLPEGEIVPVDLGGFVLAQDPVAAFGDPVVRRRDGALAYHLACVLDDAASGVTRIVRGRDLANGTATQVALQRQLGLESPQYRHHLLLLERHERKLAKLHGSVGIDALRAVYDARSLCGLLAHAAGLLDEPASTTPEQLLTHFDWSRVARRDRVAHWTGEALEIRVSET